MPWLLSLLFACLLVQAASAQPAGNISAVATDPNYVLSAKDTLSIAVINEPELGAYVFIDQGGFGRIPLLGDVFLAGLSVRACELELEKLFVTRELLKKPEVRVLVQDYASRVITVLGAVRNPGAVPLLRDTRSLPILTVIMSAGGLDPKARGDQVLVLHTEADGSESKEIVDVDALLSLRQVSGKKKGDLQVFPGDRIFVPERLF